MRARAILLLAVPVALCGCGASSRDAAPPAPPHGLTSDGIAGVRLRMTPLQVRHVLGAPTRIVSRGPHRAGFLDLTYVYRGRLRVQFLFEGGRRTVYELTTTSAAYRTSSDLGVGSSEPLVRTYASTCATVRGLRLCGVGGTSFELRDGYAVRVNVFVPPV